MFYATNRRGRPPQQNVFFKIKMLSWIMGGFVNSIIGECSDGMIRFCNRTGCCINELSQMQCCSHTNPGGSFVHTSVVESIVEKNLPLWRTYFIFSLVSLIVCFILLLIVVIDSYRVRWNRNQSRRRRVYPPLQYVVQWA